MENERYKPSVVVAANQQSRPFSWLLLLSLLMVGIAIGIVLAWLLLYNTDKLSSLNISQFEQPQALQSPPKYEPTMVKLESELKLANATIVSMQQLAAKEAQTIKALKADLSFYKSLMNIDSGKKGVSIERAKILIEDQAGLYSYEFVVQQRVLRHNLITGTAVLTAIGDEQGAEKVYTINTLTKTVDKGEIKTSSSDTLPLRFKYFQILEGQFELPESFVPKRILVKLEIKKPKPLTIIEPYSWQAIVVNTKEVDDNVQEKDK